MLIHNLQAFLQILLLFDKKLRSKFIVANLPIKASLEVFLGVNFPVPPDILNSLIVFNGVLQKRVFWIEVLMVHSNNNVLGEGSLGFGVENQKLVVTWGQKGAVNEDVFVTGFCKVWHVDGLNISELIVVAFVIKDKVPAVEHLVYFELFEDLGVIVF